MNIFIGSAWPYANGSLHIGHLAALLPGDVLARYYRLNGDNVVYVSGSDCHGTPIQVRAKNENKEPLEVADFYHKEFKKCFEELGFSYNNYTSTLSKFHKEFVQEFFIKLYKSDFVYEKEDVAIYCEHCKQFLPDRFAVGRCSVCGSEAKGDQCDNCGSLLEPENLVDLHCGICRNIPNLRKTKHIYLKLSALEDFLHDYLQNSKNKIWRDNAVAFVKRYIDEGLRDRALTRDLEWGIQVPIEGYEDKKIYVWVEAVLGYLSASREILSETEWNKFWDGNEKECIHYYIHGKDNIPFHALILPALLKITDDYHVPDNIISSEYCTLEGKKISTSNNWAIWIPYLIENYNPDTIRYFFMANGPEQRDADFSWREFINSNNGELLGAYGNFVNRNIVFVKKYYENKVPNGDFDKDTKVRLTGLYKIVGDFIQNGEFKRGLEKIFEEIRLSNKYFDEMMPWSTIKTDIKSCNDTIYTCIQMIANFAQLLYPFIPFSSEKIFNVLSISSANWSFIEIEKGTEIHLLDILFERIDKEKINEEENLLRS